MDNSFFYADQSKVIDSIIEIDKKIKEESEKKEKADMSKITKLRFEQMLRGLYINGDVYENRYY